MAFPRLRRALAPLAALALAAHAPAPPLSPAQLFGPLYAAVEERHIFPDSKTFADAEPLRPVAAILEDFARLGPVDDDALRAFVRARFDVPAQAAAAPSSTARDQTLASHVARLWPHLSRPPHAAAGSALALSEPFVVPGGRFRELYYWDSYFTMLGLVADGRFAQARGTIDDFLALIERFGHVPNGTRTYYLGRSQPPVLYLMLALVPDHRPGAAGRRLAALRREHAFWMAGARSVTMPDGARLNRYWDDRPGPRDESWAEDRATAAASGRDPGQLFLDLRAGAESGWDYSSRWLGDGRTLATIRTTRIVPVDLNALLWGQERAIAAGCLIVHDLACTRDYRRAAAARGRAIRRWLWSAGERRFGDFDPDAHAITNRPSAAMTVPLFVGLADRREADGTARFVRARLLAPGGLRTTETDTGQQWDRPNGWAPLQWFAIEGFRRTGHPALARTIATRFLRTVAAEYRASGRMLEKYDVEARRPGGGGEYPNQDGFGWTNGVVARLVRSYGEPGLGQDGR